MKQLNINIWQNPAYFLAFGFGSGALPYAPGTWGTLTAIPLYLLIQDFSLFNYIVILFIACCVGVWLCAVTDKALGTHDYPGIVWDEVCGYGLTMLAAPKGWQWVLAGFILFRIFDIWKPWPIILINNHVAGGLGVMIDDLAAAIYAWLCLHVLFYVW